MATLRGEAFDKTAATAQSRSLVERPEGAAPRGRLLQEPGPRTGELMPSRNLPTATDPTSAMAPTETEVTVSIGRIEVVAEQKARREAPVRREARPRRVFTLDDYLASRRDGR